MRSVLPPTFSNEIRNTRESKLCAGYTNRVHHKFQNTKIVVGEDIVARAVLTAIHSMTRIYLAVMPDIKNIQPN